MTKMPALTYTTAKTDVQSAGVSRALARTRWNGGSTSESSAPPTDVAGFLDEVERLAGTDAVDRTTLDQAFLPPNVPSGNRLGTVLLRTVSNPHASVSSFLASADVMRRAFGVARSPIPNPPNDPHRVPRLLQTISSPRAARVRAAIETLEHSIARQIRPRELGVANALAINAAHLGRLMRSTTGMGFRQWRLVLTMKAAVHELVRPDSRVAQTAYKVGYQYPSQFDRDFRQMFGISPTSFRRLWDAAISIDESDFRS